MAYTYEPIATQTVSGVSSVSFTSIPSTYTDLKVVFSGYNDAPLMYINYNGSTSGYSTTFVGGNGSVAASARYGSPWLYVWAPGAGTYFNLSVDVMSYANTARWKSWICKGYITDNSGGPTLWVGTWASTAAINRVDIFTSSLTMSGNFTIYGIKAA